MLRRSLGTSRFVAVPGDVVIDIVPGPPAALSLVGPRLTRPGVAFTLRVNAHDRWGNACVGVARRAEVIASVDGERVYERQIEFGAEGWATAALAITGFVADRLDRRTIGRALRARHTFAASGERPVALTRCADFIQGDEFVAKGPARIEYRFLGNTGWDELVAYDHSGPIWRRNLQGEAGYSATRIRVRWGGARVPDRYRWANGAA